MLTQRSPSLHGLSGAGEASAHLGASPLRKRASVSLQIPCVGRCPHQAPRWGRARRSQSSCRRICGVCPHVRQQPQQINHVLIAPQYLILRVPQRVCRCVCHRERARGCRHGPARAWGGQLQAHTHTPAGRLRTVHANTTPTARQQPHALRYGPRRFGEGSVPLADPELW